MNTQEKMYTALLMAYDQEINTIEKILSSKLISASIFISAATKPQLNHFSHQFLLKGSDQPKEFTDFLTAWLERIRAERALFKMQLDKLLNGNPVAHEA